MDSWLGAVGEGQNLVRRLSSLRHGGLSRRAEVGVLLAAFALALGLRVVYLHIAGIWYDPPEYDGIEYDMLAAHLLEGHGFALAEGQPYGFRPPGFPFYLAFLYAIFGRSYLAVRLANAFLGALTCLPVYVFTKRVWRSQTAVIASLGVAAHPLLIYFTGMIYPECLMLFLLAVAFLLANHAAQSRQIKEMVPLGLVSAFLVYLRPGLLAFGLAQTVWIWLFYGVFKRRFLACAALIAIVVLVIAPWSVRNFLAFDEFVWMSTNGGVTFWSSNNPLADGGCTAPSPATWLGPDPPADLRGWPDLTETQSEARFRAAAVGWIRGHLGEFLRLLPKKLIRAWSLNFGNEARPVSLPAAVPVVYSLFLIVCLIGFVLSLKKWQDSLVLYLLIIVSAATTLIFYGSTRQSCVLVLPLVVFAAWACDSAWLAASGGYVKGRANVDWS